MHVGAVPGRPRARGTAWLRIVRSIDDRKDTAARFRFSLGGFFQSFAQASTLPKIPIITGRSCMKILGIVASAAALALTLNVAAPNVAAAQTAPDAGTAAPPNELAEVIVTGTRRLDRTVAESSAPIDVITGTDLTNYPAASMLDTLSNLVPSFIVGQNSISDASSFVRSPSLRGLPADEMLVMLNGKRMNRSALVQVYQGGETELAFGSQGPDLNSIPSIAVKSLEILR